MRKATAQDIALPAVACLGPIGAKSMSRDLGHRAGDSRRFVSPETLLSATSLPSAVLVVGVDANTQAHWLSLLRQDPRFGLLPLFVDQAYAALELSAADGVAGAPEACVDLAAAIGERLAGIGAEAHADPELRLLAFMHTRPQRALAPQRDAGSARTYRYPLLDAFASGVDQHAMIESLGRRRLIEPATLIDRVRGCPACDGALLSYIDLCAHCGHLDISEKIFLHCYACGHVAEQEQFIAGEGLCCRKCQARLRHIGVDYDRALETWHCAACDSRFIDPQIKARCLQCEASHATTDLAAHPVAAWRLTAAGALAARTGNVGGLFNLLDELNYAHPAYFERTLDWQLDLRRRHREVTFGLVCIRLGNVRELIATHSRTVASQLIDTFAARLRELVRTTDVVTRTDDAHCWLLLPQTPPGGIEILRTRIEALPASGVADDGPRLQLTVAALSADTLGDADIPATLLMSELQGRLPA